MPAWLVVVAYVVAILVIVMIHEAGHYFTAKAFGIKVQEFFVGFGPRLWSIRRGETEYGIKALPLGGYVRIAGMNPFEEVPAEDLPRTFQAKPIWQRAIVIATGPFTHFVMAVVFAAVLIMAIGVPLLGPVIGTVVRTLDGQPSPAATAGILPGDRIVALDGRPVRPTTEGDGIEQVVLYTRSHVGEPITLTVERDGRRLDVVVTPVLSEIDGEQVGRIGTIIETTIVARDRADPLTAVGRGAAETYRIGKEIILRLDDVFGPSGLRRLWDLLTGQAERTPDDVQSVVGGGRTLVQAADAVGFWEALLGLLIVFNVFIGILNLIPLPPLDGGHLAVLAYEKIRGRRPDARKLIPLTAVVAAFMIMFALSITYLDIVDPVPNQFR